MSGLDSTARTMRGGRAWARDLAGAVALVEGAIAQRVFLAVGGADKGVVLPSHNVFGEPLAVEHGTDVVDLVRRCARAAEQGERVALVARASELATARSELVSIAARRLEVVVHTLAEPSRGDTPASDTGLAPALALDDLLWGMLLCAGVSDAIDLALIARRAAEDSGCPFFVVHEVAHAHDVEPVAAPSLELCEAFVGPAQGRARRGSQGEAEGEGVGGIDAPPADDRAFAERVPFALGSAMRELEGLTGRHHDVIERAPGSDAGVALVGAGALGDSIIADVERLRAGGHDVAAVRVVAWRPFPAPRLVKALGRALVVAVLERVDQPLASGAPLAVQLKAAFADALTWAPDYPGIGRIPRIVSGIVAPQREVDSRDLDAIVQHVLADERGKRTFVLGAVAGTDAAPGGSALQHASTPPALAASPGSFVMRGIVSRREIASAAAELCAAVLASALGLRTRVAVRELPEDEGGGFAFDLVASRQRPRGGHAPHAVGVLAVGDLELLSRGEGSRGSASRGNALSRLARSGVLAICSDRRAADALWSDVPPWAKAVVFDRGARVLGWTGGRAGAGVGGNGTDGVGAASVWVVASAFVGVALAVVASDRGLREAGVGEGVDGAVVEREVAEALRGGVASHAKDAGGVAEGGGKAARATFEAIVEVPRATIERDDDGVRLGRRPRP
jgi:pyruvate ferredoxin oxidoreductase alpha subunit